tara:strand:+ start:1608 stop:2054 length:447 start_codon:yes stop_codon:yes gene_type:complete
MAEKEYHINHYKVRDACSIMWVSDEYNINQLEPYISSIGCDDGEDYHYLISSEWPEAKGKDDFKTLELNDFEAVANDGDNEYSLCFTAWVTIDLDRHPKFKEALEKSDNQVLARIGFKHEGKPMIDNDGYEEYLYEMSEDHFSELTTE